MDTPAADITVDVLRPNSANGNAAGTATATIPGLTSSSGGHLSVRGAAAWFGARQILDDINLEARPGTVTALIGPSGCGKSTLLRVLNRMHELIPGAAMAGDIELDGRDIYESGMRPAHMRLRIGMVFQKPNPFPTMTIRENVLSGLRLAGVPCRNKDELVEKCLTRGGLWNEVKDRLNAPAGALSGGQQQRLCIARSLAVEPRVLLMDEPCSALDPSSTKRIEETIREICSSVTVVIVTHNMQQAARVSDFTAFLLGDHGEPGRLVESGPTGQLFNSPNNPKTEDYIHGRFG